MGFGTYSLTASDIPPTVTFSGKDCVWNVTLASLRVDFLDQKGISKVTASLIRCPLTSRLSFMLCPALKKEGYPLT